MTTTDMEVSYDRTAELAVLSACLISPTARTEAKRHITGADFQDPRNEQLWDTMMALERSGAGVDAMGLHSAVQGQRGLPELVLDVMTAPAVPENVDTYAETVRAWAVKRRISSEALRVLQQALKPDTNAGSFAVSVANRFAAIRDSGVQNDVTGMTLAEILAEPDDEPDWLIPGLLERRDRFMLTGEEGLGKSFLLRQFAICAAAGIDPWEPTRKFPPVRTAIFDSENTTGQVRRATRGIAAFAAHHGRKDVAERVVIRTSSRVDITRDKDLALIHHELDAQQPELVVIGPLYRLVPRAIQSDDDAAPVLAALDTIRDRGICLLIEAHAGHAIGKQGNRDMRPRGSSALLGWPEFGYGMRDLGAKGKKYAAFTAWRGNRSEREWPHALRRADDGIRWVPYEGSTEMDSWT